MGNILSKIFEEIKEASDNDLRFAQIVSNVFDEIAKSGQDPFYVSDEKFLAAFLKYKEE